MKKLLKFSLIIAFAILLLGMTKVYAISGDVELKPSTNQVKDGEEFTVDVTLKNIQSQGIIAFGGTLKFDDNLTLVKFEGKNGWETPSKDISFGDEGDIAINRGSLGKEANEVMFTITFKANGTGNANISIKDIMVSDRNPLSIDKREANVTVVANTGNSGSEGSGSDNTGENGNTGSGTGTNTGSGSNNGGTGSGTGSGSGNTGSGSNTGGGSSNNGSGSNTGSGNNGSQNGTLGVITGSNNIIGDNTTSDGKLPQTGDNFNALIITSIVVISVVGVGAFIKVRKSRKEF